MHGVEKMTSIVGMSASVEGFRETVSVLDVAVMNLGMALRVRVDLNDDERLR
jgi:hypothetical protein